MPGMVQQPTLPVSAGQVLAGKYRVERVLGVGGMGVVVEALHLDLERRVALKFMLGEAASNGEAVARFMREGRAAARLRSEHVAQVLDVGRLETGEPYMVMEYLDGLDLSALIKAEGPQAPDRAVSLVLQACEAVSEAHAVGIVHRDLKPSNLFLANRPDGTPLVKVLDFGISKVARVSGSNQQEASMTSTSAMLGSPAYMSPEQVRSAKNVDARTDIWALGIILYELLTAQAPFDADSLPGLIAAIISDPPVAVDRRRAALPPGLSAIVMRCLEKDPANRFDSVAALARALEPFAFADDAALVARIIRLQKSAGLTQLDTTRPPAASVSNEALAPAQSAPGTTAATFGVTANRKPSGRRGLMIAAVAVACVVAGGTVAWWTASGRAETVASPSVEESASAAAVLPDAGALSDEAGVLDGAVDVPDSDAAAGEDAKGEVTEKVAAAPPPRTTRQPGGTARGSGKTTKPAATAVAPGREARDHAAPPRTQPSGTKEPKEPPKATVDLSERR